MRISLRLRESVSPVSSLILLLLLELCIILCEATASFFIFLTSHTFASPKFFLWYTSSSLYPLASFGVSSEWWFFTFFHTKDTLPVIFPGSSFLPCSLTAAGSLLISYFCSTSSSFLYFPRFLYLDLPRVLSWFRWKRHEWREKKKEKRESLPRLVMEHYKEW